MRKIIAMLTAVFIVIANSSLVFAKTTDKDQTLNIDSHKNGVVELSHRSEDGKRVKVLIEKEGVKYQYNLNNEGKVEAFPLQMGNGTYNISILENIEGNKYLPVYTVKKVLEVKNQNTVFLNSVQQITWDSESEASKLASDITKGLKTDDEKIFAIYNFVVNNFKYDYEKLANLPSTYLPDANAMLNDKTGICYDFSSLFAVMLRSQGIPAKLVKGYTDNVEGYHAWNEVLNSKGQWIVVDTTYDAQMREHGYNTAIEKKAEEYTKKLEF